MESLQQKLSQHQIHKIVASNYGFVISFECQKEQILWCYSTIQSYSFAKQTLDDGIKQEFLAKRRKTKKNKLQDWKIQNIKHRMWKG